MPVDQGFERDFGRLIAAQQVPLQKLGVRQARRCPNVEKRPDTLEELRRRLGSACVRLSCDIPLYDVESRRRGECFTYCPRAPDILPWRRGRDCAGRARPNAAFDLCTGLIIAILAGRISSGAGSAYNGKRRRGSNRRFRMGIERAEPFEGETLCGTSDIGSEDRVGL